MALSPEPSLDELLWSIACARIIFGPEMNIQAPPNLTPRSRGRAGTNSGAEIPGEDLRLGWRALLDAGINDWGGMSPVTRDFVNPEKPWPFLGDLALVTAEAGFELVPRLPIYPEFLGLLGQPPVGIDDGPRGQWLVEGGGREGIRAAVLRHADSEGYVRGENGTNVPFLAPAYRSQIPRTGQ